MSDKPSVTEHKPAVRQMAIAFVGIAFCAVVTYPTVQHANGDGAYVRWVITCLFAVFFFVVVLPVFTRRTKGLQQRKDAAKSPEHDRTTSREPLGPQLSSRPADDPWWQDVFAKFDAGERGLKAVSIIGLVLGPLYYFILRMWRKGLAIIGIALCVVVILDLLHVLLGLPSFVQNIVGVAMSIFCMFKVKHDYYMLKRHDESMWPQIKWLNSRAALTALIVVPLLVEMGRGIAVDPDDMPTKASANANVSTVFISSFEILDARSRRFVCG